MIKNLLRNTLLTLSITLTAITSANAALITQDIIFDDATSSEVLFEKIGSLTVDTKDQDGFGLISSWVDFQLFGFDMITETEANGDFLLFGEFSAFIDLQNIEAGIEFLTFDVTESQTQFFNFQGLVDTATGDNFFIDVFDFSGGLYAFGDIALDKANIVPEPSMLLLFFTGIFFFYINRTKQNT